MQKPAFPDRQDDPQAWENLRTIVQTILGRRRNKLTPITPRKLTAAAGPTQDEYNALAARVLQLEQVYEQIRDRLDD